MTVRWLWWVTALLSIAAPFASAQVAVPLDDGRSSGVHQTLSVTATARSYSVGMVDVNERVTPFSWRLTSSQFGFTIAGEPLQLDAPAEHLRAWTPLTARADVLLRVGDTLSVYGRTGSSPLTLDTLAIRAINAVNTSVLDLSSQSLGVPARVGVRGVFSFPVVDVVLGLAGALEQEARPRGFGVTYWQGTTVRGSATVNALFGERHLAVALDLSYSNADSLGGRNQFAGGGTAGLSTDFSGALDDANRWWFIGNAFYSRPFDNVRSDQPTRLIPSGTFVGLSGSLLTQTNAVTWTPSVQILRESSSADVTVLQGTQRTRTSLMANAYSVTSSVSVDIPFGKIFTFTPEVGAVGGTVSSSLRQSTGRVIGRRGRPVGPGNTDAFSDPVRGWWSGIGLSARF